MEYLFKFKKTLNSQKGLPAIASRRRLQAGQTLLIIVLIMVVGLTVGLAVASRSIINVRTSTEEENSQRAFSAAEAGIEQALRIGCITPTPPGTGTCNPVPIGTFGDNMSSTFNTNITSLRGEELLLNGGNPVPKDEGIDVWLVEHDSSGRPDYTNKLNSNNMTVHWGALSDTNCNSDPLINNMAAIEAIVISGTVINPQTNRYVYDPCPGRRSENNFAPPASGGGGTVSDVTFNYQKNIKITNGLVMRIIPIYASTPIGIDFPGESGKELPSQGNKIDSIGTSGLTKRKVTYYKGYPALPVEFFQYVLFSPK